MEIFAWVTLSLVFLWMIWMVFINWNRKGLPPYALKIPFLGNIHLLLMNGKSHHLIFGKIKEKLGPIYTMWFGKVPIIIVSDFEIAKKMLVSSTFAGRPQRISGEIISRGFKGIIITDYNDNLKERRRTATKVFQWHDKSMLESVLRLEADSLVERINIKLDTFQTNILQIKEDISLTTFNIIWKLLFNRRIGDGQSKEFENVTTMLELLNEGLLFVNILEGFPFLKKLGNRKLNMLYKFGEIRDNIIIPEFVKHMKTGKKSCFIDFVDLLLSENTLSRDEQEMVVSDLVVAGFHTVSNTLNFVVMYLVLNPYVIERCLAEINRVLCDDIPMSVNLTSEFHYINAVIAETLRLRPVGPLGAPHKANTDTVIMNYTVPKNTTIMLNIFDIHHSEAYFEKPEQFMPERFLDSKGHFRGIDGYFPFGTGRRECLGKRFAEKEMVYLVVTLIRNYKLSQPLDEDINLEPISGGFLTPKPYRVRIEKSSKCIAKEDN